MNAVFTPKPTRIDTERYQKMVAAGVLNKYDRIELIEGEMLDMAPIGSQHAALTARLNRMLVLGTQNLAAVFPGGPINLGDFSEPQPDLLVLRPRADDYSAQLPTGADALLIVEVSDSTLAFDQGVKLSLYARFGIPEYWVVDVASKGIVVYREPADNGYRNSLRYTIGDTVSPLALPQVVISVRELFG